MNSVKFINNIKAFANKPYTSFILMGLTACMLCQDSHRNQVLPDFTITSLDKHNIPLNQINSASPLVNDKNREQLNNVANFVIPKTVKPHNISRHVTRIQLGKKEYFLALVSQAEGFKPGIYKDNKGFALGNGWNLTKQSPKYNKELAQAVFHESKIVNTLSDMSEQSPKAVTTKQIEAVSIAPQQALQITYLIGEKIRKEYVIPGISQVIQKNQQIDKALADKISSKVFNNLKKNEQEAIVYHAYKCGGNSFLKFNNLITKLVDYSLKKNIKKESIIEEFNYSYKIDGVKYLDKQSQEIVGAMFMGPQHFALASKINPITFDNKKIKTVNPEKINHKIVKIH